MSETLGGRRPTRIVITVDFDDGTFWEITRGKIESLDGVVEQSREFVDGLVLGGNVAATGQTFNCVFGSGIVNGGNLNVA